MEEEDDDDGLLREEERRLGVVFTTDVNGKRLGVTKAWLLLARRRRIAVMLLYSFILKATYFCLCY